MTTLSVKCSETMPGLLVACSIPALPQSANALIRCTRSGHVYKTERAKTWEALAVSTIQRALKSPLYDGPVKFVVRFTQRARRRWDLDNRIKSVQDCLAPAGVIMNDVQVWHIEAYKIVGNRDKTEIEVWKMKGESDHGRHSA